MFINSTTGEIACQEDIELVDGGRRWKERKSMTLKVARLMNKYDPDRAGKLRRCGTYLSFMRDPAGGSKLVGANFCRERLCPMCQWRRSLRLAVQADKVYARLNERGFRHLFVTLSVRNCVGEELAASLDLLYESYTRLTRSKRYKAAVLGSYTAVEVTYNKVADTYHPHLHCIWTVNADYFDATNPDYITKDDLIQMWRKSAHLDYDPSVDIKAIKQKPGQSMTSACVESCKYPVKSADVTFSDTLKTIDYALRGRRLLRWTGLPAEVRRELRLEDIETGDLVHVDDAPPEITEEMVKVAYVWRHGFYIPIEYQKQDT